MTEMAAVHGAGAMGLEDVSDDGGVRKRRSHKNQCLELTHLERVKQAFDKEEPFQTVDS